MSSETLHEDPKILGPEVIDQHRAIVSLMEELEAADWYNQRAHATENAELRAIIEHNRDEEKEHAAMLLEWLRRHDPAIDQNLRKYLFTQTSFQQTIAAEKAGSSSAAASDGGLAIGDLRAVPGEGA
jgi:hypothetical protein